MTPLTEEDWKQANELAMKVLDASRDASFTEMAQWLSGGIIAAVLMSQEDHDSVPLEYRAAFRAAYETYRAKFKRMESR